MEKIKIIFYNIFLFFIFLFLFDVIVSNFILKISDRSCYKIERNFYELKKNCSGWQRFKSSFPVVKVNTDNYGVRTNKKRDNKNQKQKVLFFGDSMTFGVGIDYKNTFVGLLESRFIDYEFYNFAIGSYSPTMHLYRLEKAIENKLIPKKIILMLDLSDIYDEGKRWTNIENSHRPSLTYDQAEVWKDKLNFVHKNFQVSKLIIDKLNLKSRILRNKIQVKKNKNSAVKQSFQASFTYINLKDLNRAWWSDEIFFKGIEKIKKKIDLISSISKKHESEFYLGIYPFGETLEHGQEAFSWEDFGKELCNQDKCILVNTFPEFQNEKNNNKYWYSKLYFIGDEHLNVYGNLFLSKILEKKIFNN